MVAVAVNPMRLAFLFGPLPTGDRPLDLRVAETSPRGMTGTDNSFVGYARAMVARGHEVHAYVKDHVPGTIDGVHVRPWMLSELNRYYDAVLSWCDPNPLRRAWPDAARLVNCQLNNFDTATPRHEDFVDVYCAPSHSLADRLKRMTRTGTHWEVLPNGCDPDAYDLSAKVPGRCIYASSPDRGLHVALEMWPQIRSLVPEATLEIYYHSMQHWFENIESNKQTAYWTNQEHARRAEIVKRLIDQPGVTHVGSVSRVQMAHAYSEAMVLAYPCDTMTYTEGFGVAVLEGCASGAVPATTSADAFGEIYRNYCPMVEPTAWENRQEWADLVVEMLTDPDEHAYWVRRGRVLAARHAWSVLGARLEQVIVEAKARKT
jgi:glycosyltransferase involved in cell wall biosynthesis